MVTRDLRVKLTSKVLQISHLLARGCVRGLAVIAIVMTYGLGPGLAIMGVSGVAMTASTTPASAWWRRGWGFRRGWGYRHWRRW
jgi:hypothetical protein